MEFIGEPKRVLTIGGLRVDRVVTESAEGRVSEHGLLRCPSVAAVLPYDLDRGGFYLARQRRRGALGAFTIEAPAGKVNPQEAFEDGARRELSEELGVVARDWKLVASGVFSTPGYSDEEMWLYLASRLSVMQVFEEGIQRIWVPLSRLDAVIAAFERPIAPGESKRDLKTLTLLLRLSRELSRR